MPLNLKGQSRDFPSSPYHLNATIEICVLWWWQFLLVTLFFKKFITIINIYTSVKPK